MGYSNKYWTCPFFRWDEKLNIHCEGGRIRFPDQRALNEYAQRHCASPDGWQTCSMAASLNQYYERTADGTKHRQD